MNEFLVEIISPEKKIFEGKVVGVSIPGTKGNFQVLFNHAPLISTFEIGMISVDLSNNTKKVFSTSGGSVEVLKNSVLILSDTIEAAESIDLERAIKSKTRAEERLAKRTPDIDIERARASLARAVNRIRIAEKYSLVD